MQQQAEFLQRLCLAITFARQTSDPTATAAVEAVRATDEVLQKSRRALRFVGGAATGRGEQSDGEDDDGAAPRPAEKDELGDEPDPLLDLKQLPPLRCEMAPSVIHILGAIFDSDSTVVAKRRLSRSDDSSMRVCVAPFLLLRFEILEEGAMRPDVHDGTSESGGENRYMLYASAPIRKSVYLAVQVSCGSLDDKALSSQGTISIKKPDGRDAIEVGHWECTVSSAGDDAASKADDGEAAKAEAKPPFLKSAFPHLPASDAPLPRGDGPDAKDWHWLELPADTISAAGCYVVEFSLSTGDDKLKISGVAAMASDEYLVEFKSRTWSEALSEDERRRHMCQARLRPKQSSAAAAASSSSADHRKPPPKRLSGARDGGGGGGATERRRLRYLNFNAEDDEVDVALDASGAVTKLTLGGEAVPFKRIFILPKVSADGRVASKDPSPLLREEGTNERPATVCVSSSSSPRRRTSARRSTCGSTRPSRSTARCG